MTFVQQNKLLVSRIISLVTIIRQKSLRWQLVVPTTQDQGKQRKEVNELLTISNGKWEKISNADKPLITTLSHKALGLQVPKQ